LLTYPATIPGLSTAHLRYLAGVLREHRAAIGCRWRKLPPARQALLVLAHLRCGDTYAQLAASFRVGTTTVYRYVCEAVELLAALAPQLGQVIADRLDAAVTILDGTIIPTMRVRWTSDHQRWYVHRKKTYGVNLQALADEHGNLLWLSEVCPLRWTP